MILGADNGLTLSGQKSAGLKSNQIVILECGGSSFTVTPDGIWINGPQVLINSGAGPSPPELPVNSFGDPGGPDAADDSVSGLPSNE
jgi:hypothetical protein